MPDRFEELGLLCWKIGVLVIGLRLVIVAPAQLAVVVVLAQATRLLLAGALALVVIDLFRLLGRVMRRARLGGGTRSASTLQQLWRAWLCDDWLFPLAINGLLAATVILVAVILAVQARLDWGGVAWLFMIGVIRVAFQEFRLRAGDSAGKKPQARLR